MGLNDELASHLKGQINEDVPGARFDVPFATTPLGFYYGRIEKAKAGVFKATDRFARTRMNRTLEGTNAGQSLVDSVSLDTTLDAAVGLMRQTVTNPLNPIEN